MSPRDIPDGGLAVAPAQPAAPAARPKPSILLLVAMTGLGPFTMQMAHPVGNRSARHAERMIASP